MQQSCRKIKQGEALYQDDNKTDADACQVHTISKTIAETDDSKKQVKENETAKAGRLKFLLVI